MLQSLCAVICSSDDTFSLHAIESLIEIGEEHLKRRCKFRTLFQKDTKDVEVVSVVAMQFSMSSFMCQANFNYYF